MRVTIKNSALIILGIFFCFTLKAQDVHFSQFYASPLTLNPALTGAFENSCRAALNVRDQWRGQGYDPYTTLSVSYEQKGYRKEDNFGVGGILVQDELPVYGYFNTRIYASGAYHKNLGNQRLSLGVQPGLVYRSYDDTKSFPDQFDRLSGTFDPNDIVNGENGQVLTKTVFDFSFGLEWMADFDFIGLHAGIANFHMMGTNQSFFGDNDLLNRLWTGTAGASYSLNDSWKVNPNVILMFQGNTKKIHLGGGVEKSLGEGNWKYLNLSTYVRTAGDVIAIIGAGYKNFDVGFSYDVGARQNISNAFELSLIYNCNFNAELPDFYVPCNRY